MKKSSTDYYVLYDPSYMKFEQRQNHSQKKPEEWQRRTSMAGRDELSRARELFYVLIVMVIKIIYNYPILQAILLKLMNFIIPL